jgi:hypothetical protein
VECLGYLFQGSYYFAGRAAYLLSGIKYSALINILRH